jgi:LCP family protein required for cell wall assembly
VLLACLLVLVLIVGGSYLYARSIFNRIERVEVSQSLTSASRGTNYLIVGSDSREGGSAEGPAGQRADTIMLLHLEGGKAQMMSIPRDLYVPIAGTGASQKINAAYNGGAPRLVDTVTESLGIPVDRYMEVDFVSFAGLVDGLGGITLDFEHPAQDTESGLYVPVAGEVELDGEQALAYVRSRHYTEMIDGQYVKDHTADLGRMQRQQKFLSVVIEDLSATKNPFALSSAAGGMAEGLRIDDDMSMFDAMRFAWGMRGMADPLPPLPVSDDRNASGAVLILDEAAAQPILDQVR